METTVEKSRTPKPPRDRPYLTSRHLGSSHSRFLATFVNLLQEEPPRTPMSVLRSLVASTSSSPSSSSPAARSLVFLRRLATAPPAPDSVIAAFQSRSPLAKWELGVPQLVQAQLPPSILNAVDQPRFVHPPKAPLDTPAKFIGALGRGLTKKLDGKVSLETMPWKHLMQWSHEQWMEKGGLEHKDAK